MIPYTPSAAMIRNQAGMIGPNARPSAAVPNGCTANSASRMAIAAGSTYPVKAGAICSMPSSAESTEIAGVIAPSPYMSAAPKSSTEMMIGR